MFAILVDASFAHVMCVCIERAYHALRLLSGRLIQSAHGTYVCCCCCCCGQQATKSSSRKGPGKRCQNRSTHSGGQLMYFALNKSLRCMRPMASTQHSRPSVKFICFSPFYSLSLSPSLLLPFFCPLPYEPQPRNIVIVCSVANKSRPK